MRRRGACLVLAQQRPLAMIVYRKAIELVRLLRELVELLRHQDAEIAQQLHRASRSTVLNVAEGRSGRGKNRQRHFALALGSARETHACLELSLLGIANSATLHPVLALSDEVQAMLYVLSR